MVQSNNIRFNPYDNLSNIIHPLNNLDFDIKLKLKEKETKLKETKLKEKETKEKSVMKKKKKPISSTIKKLVWNTNIGEEKGKSKCMCL